MADTQLSRVFAATTVQPAGDFPDLNKERRAQREVTPIHLLVVDDDEEVRAVCRDVARDCGLEARDVSTAEEALEVLGASSVDILLTDLRLPGTSGLDLLRRVSVAHPDEIGRASCR